MYVCMYRYVCIYIYTSPCPDDFSMRSMRSFVLNQQQKTLRPTRRRRTRQDTSDLESPKLSLDAETVDAMKMP